VAVTNSGTRQADAAPADAATPDAATPDAATPDAVTPDAVAPAPPSRFTRLWPSVTRVPPPASQGLLALAVYLAVFIIGFGLPLISHLNVPNIRQYWTDPQFYVWSLRWWPYAVSHGINPLFSSQIGAPHGYDLAWASTTPSVALLMWPVTAAFGVLVSYNIVLLVVPPVSAWAAFIAARRLTGRFWAALLAGAVYGFSPFELIHNWQGQPNLTVIVLFPLMVYLVVRWWDGSLGRIGFVSWMTVLMAVEFYTFNEAFAEMTVVWAGALLIGLAVAGRAARRKVARLAGLTAIAYAGSVVLAAPYLIYSLRHNSGALTRQNNAFSLQFMRLIVPTSQQMFGVKPLIEYSSQIGRRGLDNYVGIPLLVILLLLAVFAWSSRLSRLLVIGFVLVLALAAGPVVVITIHHTFALPWGKLWSLPIARSAEPSRFIVFGSLALAIALAVWLAAPTRSRLLKGARWGLGLLAVAAVITDSPTSYQAVIPAPRGFTPPAAARPVNQLPAFITQGLYRQYLRPGEIVAVITARGNAGMLFQADANFYFRIAGGYINASLTPVDALPHPLTLVANPGKVANQMFVAYLRSAGVGAILVEQAWEFPWVGNLNRLGLHGTPVGGVIVYPVASWLARGAHPALAGRAQATGSSRRAHSTGSSRRARSTGSSPRELPSCGLVNVSRLDSPERMAPIRKSGFTFSDTNARAPVGIGSQKLTTRQPRTPSVATLLVTPKPTSSSGRMASTTPSPPGVIGSAPATLAMP
jgi:hypothetical protein